MTKEKAAKYFIVAWLKDWKLSTYVETVTGEVNFPFEKAHKEFPWLPKHAHWYFNGTTRRYIADSFLKLNNMLWDSKSNEERLSFSVLVEKLNGRDSKPKADKHKKKEVSWVTHARRSGIAHRISVDAMRRGSGHHWAVAK